MKKMILSTIMVVAVAVAVMAVPAKKGLTKTIKLTDGTEVQAELVGDEHGHYWKTADGKAFMERNDGDFVAIDAQQIISHAKARRSRLHQRHKAMCRVSMGDRTHYTGNKKGLVILMNYKDLKFQSANNLAKYRNILNKAGYNEGNFKGSVADYFKAQSGGDFVLTFDVVGPFTAQENMSYYGANNAQGDDQHPEQLIVEAVTAANSSVNFKDYDWDNDGEVDQVFIVYAGKGEADGGASNTIWPHMWALAETDNVQTLDGVKINTYACANELSGSSISGIGCFCHEFSHCLGYPDFYDTSYSGWYGMGDWDLMCGGSYNGNAFRPAGYTSYEKWMAGWLEPVVLDKDMKVDNLKPISNGGGAYVLYNSGHADEYYLIENRQKVNWDSALPGKGLMITHVDFDKNIWQENTPNTRVTAKDVENYAAQGYTVHENDHQRCTIFRAGSSTGSSSAANDLYPYKKMLTVKNSLTATSQPAATLYNENAEGNKKMEKGITEITQNADGTMSFIFGEPQEEEEEGDVTGIKTVTTKAANAAIYTLEGRYVGADIDALPRRLYIVNGRKVVK